MTTTTTNTHPANEDGLSVEIVSEADDEDEEAHGNGLLSADKTDSALEEEDKEESTGTDIKATATMNMNGCQYLAVLVEPSSSSGIDVVDQEQEQIQPMWVN